MLELGFQTISNQSGISHPRQPSLFDHARERRGLWRDPDPVAPWEWRLRGYSDKTHHVGIGAVADRIKSVSAGCDLFFPRFSLLPRAQLEATILASHVSD